MNMNPFLARFSGKETLVDGESQALFESCLAQGYVAFQAFEQRQAMAAQVEMQDDFWFPPNDWRAHYRPYVVKDGTLQIPIKGVLLHDFSYAFGDWLTGYVYIAKAFERGMADPEVKRIALMCHSPGGEVAGNFDLVDKMFAYRGTKPVRAFAHEAAYSAAYSIASVADQIVVARTGGVGSIGVVTMHMDISEAMAERGVKITFIFAGKHKVDGNPYEPLPADVKDRIQERIDALMNIFVSTVARNRGLDEQAVRDTQAATFMAPEAVSNGLADSIGSLDDAVAAFAADLSSDEGEDEMSGQKDETAVAQAAHEAAVATARTDGEAAGRKAEKDRIVAIIGSDAAKDRPSAALAAALDTDMTAEQAATFLGKLPTEKPADKAESTEGTAPAGGVGGNRFDDAMQNTGNPNLGAGGEAQQQSRAQRAAAAAFGVPKSKSK